MTIDYIKKSHRPSAGDTYVGSVVGSDDDKLTPAFEHTDGHTDEHADEQTELSQSSDYALPTTNPSKGPSKGPPLFRGLDKLNNWLIKDRQKFSEPHLSVG